MHRIETGEARIRCSRTEEDISCVSGVVQLCLLVRHRDGSEGTEELIAVSLGV